MRKTSFLLTPIVLCYIVLRIDILVNLAIARGVWQLFSVLGLLNLFLIYLIARKYLSSSASLISVFVYAASPLIAYFEFAASNYLVLLTFLLIVTLISLPIVGKHKKYIYQILSIFLLIAIPALVQTDQISLYRDPGVINGLNQLRGESVKNGFGLESKLIENKFSYLGLHFLFNFLSQFSPAVYFTPEYKILDFSFSPPVLLGFVFTTLIGLVYLGKNLKSLLPVCLVFALLVLPSALSKESPDLERLVIVIPLLALLSGYGFSKVSQFEYKWRRVIYLLLFALVILQFGVVVFDIAAREPVRLMLLKS